MKRRAADLRSRLKTKWKDKTVLENKVPVLAITKEILACAPRPEMTDIEFFEEREDPLVPFISEVCMWTVIKNNEKAEIRMLLEFMSAQYTDTVCRSAFASVRIPNTRFKVDSKGVLV